MTRSFTLDLGGLDGFTGIKQSGSSSKKAVSLATRSGLEKSKPEYKLPVIRILGCAPRMDALCSCSLFTERLSG